MDRRPGDTRPPSASPEGVLRSDSLVRALPGPDEALSLEAALDLAVREAPLGIAVLDQGFRFVLLNAASQLADGGKTRSSLVSRAVP